MNNPESLSPHIRAKLAEFGKEIELVQTSQLFASMHQSEPYEGVSLVRDVPYGVHERNLLDVFSPSSTSVADELRPVVVFVPGGGFSQGGKRPGTMIDGLPTYFYDNVATWAVANGMLGLVIDYRLAPEHSFPSGIEDMAALLKWVGSYVSQYGGDPGQTILWGHSAGAAHVADFLAARGQKYDSLIRGAILTSGFYLLPEKKVSMWHTYYGTDVSKYRERSSLPGLVASKIPLMVTDTEFDPDMFQEQSNQLASERAQVGNPVVRLHLPYHSHISELLAVGTADLSLSGPVLDFIQQSLGSRF